MKTKQLLYALAALAIAGCSENEITQTTLPTDQAIGFDVYTGVQTKGTESTSESLKTSHFGIFAYLTTTDWSTDQSTATPGFMTNEKATHSGSWGYTNTQYWPTNSDKVSFFAYAPYTDKTAGNGGYTTAPSLPEIATAGEPKITFTQGSEPQKLIDFVTAKAIDQTATSNSGKVSFAFKHTLTKIAVQAKVALSSGTLNENTKVYITGLKLKPKDAQTIPTTGFYNLSTEAWDYSSSTKMAADGMDLAGILNKAEVSSFGGYTHTGAVSVTTTAASVFSNTHALYLIPANNTTGTAAEGDALLEVTYDIVTKTGDATHVKTTATKVASLPQYAMKQNTVATYTLKISMNAVEIEGTVESWGTTDATEEITPTDRVP